MIFGNYKVNDTDTGRKGKTEMVKETKFSGLIQ